MLPDRSASDVQLSTLDAQSTLSLCETLGDYGEAGALSHDLMMRAGRYATSQYAGNLDILLAAARMYRLGGELELARKALLRAGALEPREGRTLRLLGEVLGELGIQVTPARAIAEADEPEALSVRSQAQARVADERDARALAAMGRVLTRHAGAEAPRVSALPMMPSSSRSSSSLVSASAAVSSSSLVSTPSPRAELRPSEPRHAEPRVPEPRASEPRHAEPRRPSSALRLPEALRSTQSGTRTTQSGAAPGDRDRDRERSSGRAIAAMRERERESALAPAPQPAGESRIKLLDPGDPGRFLDRYELIGEIASGGMATVFLARRDGAGGFQRLVAIKRLHPHLAHQAEFVEMFLDEARLAAAIHHPHVVPILESENGSYVVMEFIEGDTLAGLCERALARGVTLPRAVVVRIVLDALAGLHAAHQVEDAEGRQLGLVHRDCTPQNILVGTDGSSRITDFGVARAASRLAVTRSQTVKGKVAYLSPEQATAGTLDRRSDLFTMGIVLWEALAGQPLFLTDHDATTISRLLSGPIPSVRKLAPDVSPELDEVCARALQRNAARRYPTAAAMAEALEIAARNTGDGAGSPGEVGRCVETLLGADLAAQRDAVRAWLAQSESLGEASRRNHGSETPSVRVPAVVEVPHPPSLPRAELEATLASGEAAPARISAPMPPSKAAPASTATPAAPKELARAEATAPIVPVATDAKKRLRTRLTVAAILVVGASSPLWMKRVDRLREQIFHDVKAPDNAPSSAPSAGTPDLGSGE